VGGGGKEVFERKFGREQKQKKVKESKRESLSGEKTEVQQKFGTQSQKHSAYRKDNQDPSCSLIKQANLSQRERRNFR